MSRRLSLAAYLSAEETNRPQELAFGFLREPPAPGFNHQLVVGRIHVTLDRHVRRYRLGEVVESPVDVILDRERALVAQPDIVFVSKIDVRSAPIGSGERPISSSKCCPRSGGATTGSRKYGGTDSTRFASAGLSTPSPAPSKCWT